MANPGRSAFIRRFFVMIMVMLLMLLSPSLAVIAENIDPEATEPDVTANIMPVGPVSATSSIIVETGRFRKLYGQNEITLQNIPAASKVMTALIACERLSLDIQVTISSVAAAAEEGISSPDGISLASGDKYPLRYLLYRMVFYDSDSAALAIAEQVAGIEDAFVDLMNARADSYDMADTVFINATGQSAEFEISTPADNGTPQLDLQRTTLEDFAKLAYQAIANDTFNSILRSQTQYIMLSGSTLVPMRNNIDDIWTRSEGMVSGALLSKDKGKAYTLAIGSVNGVNIIAITADGETGSATNDLLTLFWGCNNYFTSDALVYAGTAFTGTTEQTIDGDTFGLVFKQTVHYVHPIGVSDVLPTYRYNSFGPFSRPIQTGMTVGQVVFELTDGTTIAVDVSPDRQILSSISILDKALSELQGNGNLALVLIICGMVLIIIMLVQVIRRLYRLVRLAWLIVLEKRIRQ